MINVDKVLKVRDQLYKSKPSEIEDSRRREHRKIKEKFQKIVEQLEAHSEVAAATTLSGSSIDFFLKRMNNG